MAIRKIFTYPAEVLRRVAKTVDKVTPDVISVLKDMIETIASTESGIGLAAPQIGISLRLIAIDLRNGTSHEMINPKIIEREGATSHSEGCLSVPELCVEIERSEKIVVDYLTTSGKQKKITAKGLLAVVIQHEIDHLDGKLIIDATGPIKRDLYIRKLKKAKKEVCRQL